MMRVLFWTWPEAAGPWLQENSFDDGSTILISLRPGDCIGREAAIFNHGEEALGLVTFDWLHSFWGGAERNP